MTIEQLEREIIAIKQRNKRVELEKAWEKSLTRRTILMFSTYIAIGLYLTVIQVQRPWINAIVPTVGFFLSTLTLPFFKNVWEKYLYKS